MKIISYMDFLLEGRRADAIQSLTAKYGGNKEQALQYITHVEQQMMQMFNNQGLVNKYIYSVMNFIESSDNTGHSHEDSIRNVLNDMKRLIDWEPRMKQQGKQLLVDQLDKMSWFQFNAYLNDFYDEQPHDKWKAKYTKEINIDNISNNMSDYEIVHIPNWDTAKRYMGDKLTWCITQSETAFLNYTDNDTKFVFAFKPNYESLGNYESDKQGHNYDNMDEFALSALAIRIYKTGTTQVTCRYNHEVSDGDNTYGYNTIPILDKLNIFKYLENMYDKEKFAYFRLDAINASVGLDKVDLHDKEILELIKLDPALITFPAVHERLLSNNTVNETLLNIIANKIRNNAITKSFMIHDWYNNINLDNVSCINYEYIATNILDTRYNRSPLTTRKPIRLDVLKKCENHLNWDLVAFTLGTFDTDFAQEILKTFYNHFDNYTKTLLK